MPFGGMQPLNFRQQHLDILLGTKEIDKVVNQRWPNDLPYLMQVESQDYTFLGF